MKKKFNVITILALLGLIVASSITLGKAFAYFSADSSASGTITMGHLYIDDIEPSDTTSTGWNITNLQPNQSFGGSYSVDVTSDINYYTRILFKASVTPLPGKTHADGCGDDVTDPTDILNISIDDNYSKSNIKTADGYTAYYKLTPTTVESETTPETFNIDLKVYDWVGNGYCDYYMGATVSINMYAQVMQADYLEGSSIGDISSANDMHALWNGIIPPQILDVSEYSNLTFTVLDSDAKTMSVSKADTSITEANIPAQVKKDGEVYTVTEIDGLFGAFYNCTNLTSVTIPDTVTNIGGYAFSRCSGLISVTIQNGLMGINSNAFQNCSSLTFINIPSSVVYMGDAVFSGCTNLTSITIPSGVTSIGSSAFSGCTGLTSIDIPSGVTSIGKSAFAGCAGLTSIDIPSNTTSIGNYAFRNCASLTAINVDGENTGYSSIDGVLFDKEITTLITCPSGKTGNYTIPSSVASIVSSAFYGCADLIVVNIPNSVTSIGNNAFQNCSNLTSIDIQANITAVGSNMFAGCTSLTSITLPTSITSIGKNAFESCTSLTSITIPSGVTSIEESVFQNCTSLTSITLPSSVTSIGDYLFKGAGLTSIDILSSVTSIGKGAFESCTGLTSIYIPSNVTSIDDYAFRDCTSLTAINVDSENIQYLSVDGVLFNSSASYLEVCPAGKTGDYTIPSLSDKIMVGSYAFYNCAKLTSITIPSNVINIGSYAFYGCSGLTSMDISNITNIQDYTFYGCTGLTSIDITSATKISSYAFYGCTSLTEITISSSVTTISSSAFQGCTALTSITIPSSVTTIVFNVFNGCTNLTSVTFENATGWHLGSTTGPSVDVTNPSTNATNLKSSGAWCYNGLYRA